MQQAMPGPQNLGHNPLPPHLIQQLEGGGGGGGGSLRDVTCLSTRDGLGAERGGGGGLTGSARMHV